MLWVEIEQNRLDFVNNNKQMNTKSYLNEVW
jgi:hypothetical protein